MTLCHTMVFSTLISNKNYCGTKTMTKLQIKPNKRGRPAKNYTYNQINHAIQSTQSMRMASEYLNISYDTFKKWAKIHKLWNPLPSPKGIKKRNSVKLSPHSLSKILSGENPSPYRETVLLKKVFQEGYLEQKCSNCGYDCSYVTDGMWPLVLDFLDLNHKNTKIENLRVLCINCLYGLQKTQKGWYRHREIPLNDVVDNKLPRKIKQEESQVNPNPYGDDDYAVPVEITQEDAVPIQDNQESVDFIPFEEFQKTLEN